MPDPEEVRLSILTGRIPTHWHVIRGSASLAVRNVWVRGVLPQCIVFFLVWVAVVWIPPSSQSFFDKFLPFIYVLILLLTGILISFVVASMAKRAAMVFLPEGCLQFNEIESNLPNTQKILWYASIAEIELRSNFLMGPYLVMRNRDGKKQEWYPRAWYGSCARTVQNVLTSYIAYQARNVSQPEGVNFINANYGNRA